MSGVVWCVALRVLSSGSPVAYPGFFISLVIVLRMDY
jgi:hypothetical protein